MTVNKHMMKALLLGALVAVLPTAHAAETADPCQGPQPPAQCKPMPPWFDPTRVRLELSDREGGPHSVWEYEIEDPGNLVIRLDDSARGGTPNGRMMLIAGRFLVTRDIPLQKHHERDPLVIGTLHFQTLVQLLKAAFPDGPQRVTTERTVDLANDKEPIAVGTFNAGNVFAPPWKLEATVARADARTVDYRLEFSFHTEAAPATEYHMRLRGQWIKDDQRPVIPDDTPVDGWTMHYVGGNPRAYESGVILEYGAQRRSGGLKTVGSLRAAARAEPARLAQPLEGPAPPPGPPATKP